MMRDKLIAIRKCHRRAIAKRLEDAAAEGTDKQTLETYLRAVKTRMEAIKDLDSKILETTEFAPIEELVMSAEEFTVSVEVKLRKLQTLCKEPKSNIEQPSNSNSNSLT